MIQDLRNHCADDNTRLATLTTALRELRLRVLEADALAVKDADEDGFVTAYHFKTGAWHRLLSYVNGDAYDALVTYDSLSAPAAEPEVQP